MAKPVPQFDYENNLEPDLLRFLTRVESLEKIAKDENSFISMKELEWETHVSEIRREVKFLNSQLNDVRNRLERFKSDFLAGVSLFKLKADMDEFRKLESKIDSMNFENLITKEEFLRKTKLN